MGAQLKCSFGVAPSVLVVLPANRVMTGTPAANVMDHIPMLNILPFGMCQSIMNPMVAAATAAALGALTPMPCIPVTPAPWAAGAPTVKIGPAEALDNQSKLTCNWGGVIQILAAGQFTVMIP
jgi:hypothetical protein